MHGEIATNFQPIVSIRSGLVAGYEALARPVDREGNAIRPGDFFAGRGRRATVNLDRSCREAHLRNFARLDLGLVFLNVHPFAAVADADDASHVDRTLVALRGLGIPASRVCLELLENACEDERLLAQAVRIYRQAGFRIALDDFGVERSDFDRVLSLRPDFVKIDRSVLTEAVSSAKAGLLLPAIVAFLHEAGARVIVEGVETALEAQCASLAGADLLQGFYLDGPGRASRVPSAPPRPREPAHQRALAHRLDGIDIASMIGSPLARLFAAGRSMSFAA